MTRLPNPGAPFPNVIVSALEGGQMSLGQVPDWGLVVIYRGLHCPKCKDYLRQLEALRDDFAALGVTVIAASGDPADRAQAMVDETGYGGPMGYDLSVPQMRELGLYISDPLSDAETDRPFAEPGLFVINPAGQLQVHDISTAPWARPDLAMVRDGIKFAQDKGRPPRGTH